LRVQVGERRGPQSETYVRVSGHAEHAEADEVGRRWPQRR
jgi:hypothetical protein